MFKQFLVGAVLLASITGCAAFKGQGPDAPDQLVIFAGDAGLGCVAIPEKDRQLAKLAVKCASDIVDTGTVDVAKISVCASAAGVPEQYRGVFTLVLQRIQARFGSTQVFEPGSTGVEAFKAFLASCQVALQVVIPNA